MNKTYCLRWRENFLSKHSCQQPEQQSLGWWLNVRSLHSMSWSLLECVLMARDNSLLTRALNRILRTTLAIFFRILSTTALDCCSVDTFSSKMVHQNTQLVPCRTGSEPTAQISLPKISGLQIHPTWTPWIAISGGNVGGLSWALSETKNGRRTEGSPASDLGQATSGPIDKAVKEFSKRLKAFVAAEGGFWTFTVTAMLWLCYFCLNDVSTSWLLWHFWVCENRLVGAL